MIWLLAVTAVVFTTSVSLVVPVGMYTLPAIADPQTAGEADEEQFVAELRVATLMPPAEVPFRILMRPLESQYSVSKVAVPLGAVPQKGCQ
jgi:hypothetical protein